MKRVARIAAAVRMLSARGATRVARWSQVGHSPRTRRTRWENEGQRPRRRTPSDPRTFPRSRSELGSAGRRSCGCRTGRLLSFRSLTGGERGGIWRLLFLHQGTSASARVADAGRTENSWSGPSRPMRAACRHGQANTRRADGWVDPNEANPGWQQASSGDPADAVACGQDRTPRFTRRECTAKRSSNKATTPAVRPKRGGEGDGEGDR